MHWGRICILIQESSVITLLKLLELFKYNTFTISDKVTKLLNYLSSSEKQFENEHIVDWIISKCMKVVRSSK